MSGTSVSSCVYKGATFALLLLLAAFFASVPAASAAGRSNGSHLGAQIPVTAMAATASRANNSPVVVADPGDAKFLVLANRLDAPDYSCALHVSGNGGRSWTPVTPVPALPPDVEKCYGPEVAIDARGRIFFVFLGLKGAGNLPIGVYLTTSVDRGRTFSAPWQVIQGVNFAVRVAIDPHQGPAGRLHIVWLHAGEPPGLGSLGTADNPILTFHSDDGGRTFSDPIRVSDPSRRRTVAPAIALGPNHAVYVSYYDLRDDARDYEGLEGPVWDGTWQLVLRSSSDGGNRFAAESIVEPAVVPYERVMVIFTMPPAALAVQKDKVCMAWTDARNGDADILARCSRNRGQTWSAPVRVNDDPVGTGLGQYLPRIGIAPNGRVDVVFYDRRDDPQNVRNDVAYAFSRNGGRSYSPRLKLTPTGSSSSLIGQQYDVPSAGDRYDFGFRIALLSRDSKIFMAWADTHLSAPGTMSQDIIGTIVRPTGEQGGLAFKLVLLLLFIVTVLIAWRFRRHRPANLGRPQVSDPSS